MKKKSSSVATALAACACILSLSACANPDMATGERTLVGTGVGAATGLVVSTVSAGCIPCGTAVGAVVGAGVGLAYDQYDKTQGQGAYR